MSRRSWGHTDNGKTRQVINLGWKDHLKVRGRGFSRCTGAARLHVVNVGVLACGRTGGRNSADCGMPEGLQ